MTISLSLDPESFISMNIWGFSPSLFGHLEALYRSFRDSVRDDPKAEFLIPEVVKTLIDRRNDPSEGHRYDRPVVRDDPSGRPANGDGRDIPYDRGGGISSRAYRMNGQKRGLSPILDLFDLEGEVVEVIPHRAGHINDTFIVRSRTKQGTRRYTLQRINASVFPRPDLIMHNIRIVSRGDSQKKRGSRRGPGSAGPYSGAHEGRGIVPQRQRRWFLEVLSLR